MKARIPFRTQVVIGGVPLKVLTWDAERHAYSGAESCSMELALSSSPDLMAMSQEVKGESQKPLELQIFGGYVNPAEIGPPKLDLVFDGIVDSLDGDWNDDTYHIGGRSWAYLLMTAKTTAVYPSTVASEVARTIAAKHGLDFSDGGQRSQVKAGKAYAEAQVLAGRNVTEWDLLATLAQFEGRELFVRGKKLYYLPEQPDGAQPQAILYWGGVPHGVLPWKPGTVTATIERLRATHWAQFSHDIVVTCTSVHPKSGQILSANWDGSRNKTSAQANRLGGQAPAPSVKAKQSKGRQTVRMQAPRIGDREQYRFHFVGLTKNQLDERARAIWLDLSRHEFVCTVGLPGDTRFEVHENYLIQGTGRVIDRQVYRPKSVRLAYGAHEGFAASLTLTSHHVQTAGSLL